MPQSFFYYEQVRYIMNIFTPEALPILTVGVFLGICAVCWAVKTLYVELKKVL